MHRGLEVGDSLEKFAQGAPESVEAGDTQAVSGPGVVEELGEPGALGAFSRGDIGEDANGAGLEQAVALGFGVLLAGGHAGVAQRVAGPGGGGRTNIGPFRDVCGRHAVGAAQRS